MQRERLPRREFFRSADWQSAVSRIGNPLGAILKTPLELSERIGLAAPAGCPPATQQIANLRYAEKGS